MLIQCLSLLCSNSLHQLRLHLQFLQNPLPMSLLPERLVTPPEVEYLLLGEDLRIQEFSKNAPLFADNPADLVATELVVKAFPELIGAEQILEAIRLGTKNEYELKEIARRDFYFNLYAVRVKASLVLLFEDVTEMMTLKQSLVQRANEAELLLSALKNSKDYLDKVIASIGDALIITNQAGIIKSVNQAAVDIFGYSIAEFVDQPWQNFLPREIWQLELSPWAIANEQAEIKTIEVDCFSKEGQPLTVEFNCSQVVAGLTQEESLVYVGRNITARKQAEREQQKVIAKERELVELRERFLSTAAHEFRNPIGSILMCVEMLKHPKANLSAEEQVVYIDFIQQAGSTLKGIMEDILLLSKADAGKLGFNPKGICLKTVCEEMILQVQVAMGENRIQFSDRTNLDTVLMDSKLLQHILPNLLSNALKYSPNNQPVEFTIAPSPEQSDHLTFTIRDHGIGIPAKDLKHIFDSFHRAKNVGEIPGTGLGMAITHRSIQLHQGTIAIESQENQGTTVIVTLPIA